MIFDAKKLLSLDGGGDFLRKFTSLKELFKSKTVIQDSSSCKMTVLITIHDMLF